MSIESRIESGLKAAVEAEPVRIPAPLSDVKAAARRQTRQGRAARWTASGVALAAAVAFVTIQTGVEEPYVGKGETLLATDPIVVQGAPSPEPLFDTSGLGIEEPLSPITDAELALELARSFSEDTQIIRVTTIGTTVSGVNAIIQYSEASGLSHGGVQFRCLLTFPGGASCIGEDLDAVINEPGGLVQPGSSAEPDSYGVGGSHQLMWDVPSGTSVVVLTVNGESVWHGPIADVAVFDTDLFDGDQFQVTALDQHGNILESFELVARIG
ncbi:MAG: hypothetical protein V3U46_08770 [Acidimicrobiia bacterium]